VPEEMKVPALRKPKTRPRSSRRLLALLFLFFVTVLAILFFQSSLSKISSIKIEGNELLSSEAIGQASGLSVGDHFFSVSARAVESKVAAMKMVESVQVAKHFPGVITITVKEYPKVAFQMGDGGKLQAVLADGSAVTLRSGVVPDKPILTDWSDSDPMKAKLCKTLSQIPPGLLSDISEIRPDPSDGFPDKIKMYTRSQFIVTTTVTLLPEKIAYLQTYIDNLHENNISGGIITMLLADSHTPLEQASGNPNAGKSGSQDKTNKPDKPAPTQPQKDNAKTGVKETPKSGGKDASRNS
jgi:cell division protein FtsQ